MRHRISRVPWFALVAVAAACTGGDSTPTSPATPVLGGSWSGEAAVAQADPPEHSCPWMFVANPIGQRSASRAAITQDQRRVDLRFDQHAVLNGTMFVGDLAGDTIHAQLDAGASTFVGQCSPVPTQNSARVVSGTLEARNAGNALTGSATIVYQTVHDPTGEPFEEPFTLRVVFSLQRSAG